ncbi:MAG: hypothetical protein ABSG16_07935 [Candidatus Acidiferrum sp.]|jgi:hypothetical protein
MSLVFFALTLLFVPQAASKPDAGIETRGDHAMGFSHETTTHHFRLYQFGGAIEVSANDSKDLTSRDQIRMHLSHIVTMFAQGVFNVPMFIHDKMPPGASTMSKLRDQIRYQLEDTPQGARIEIVTKNKEALTAIHDFLRFQISDHETGDSVEISKP